MVTAAHILYAIAIATFLGMTIGLGANVIAPDPEPPFIEPRVFDPENPPTSEEEQELQEEFQRAWEAYQDDLGEHRRNMLIGVTAVVVVVLVAAIAAAGLPDALRLGMLLGGLGTMAWAVQHTQGEVSTAASFVGALIVLIALSALSHPRLRARVRAIARLRREDRLLP